MPENRRHRDDRDNPTVKLDGASSSSNVTDNNARQAGWELQTQRFAPQHPDSFYESFIDARYYFQLRGDALPLAETLTKALSPLHGRQRMAAASATKASDEPKRRFPELQDMKFDPHGLSDETPALRSDPQLG